MKPVDKAAHYLARELSLTEAQAEVAHYGLLSLAATSLNLAAIVILSGLLGVMREALAAVLVMTTFRKLSGGAHCSTLHGCIITGTAVIVLIGLVTRNFSALLGSSVVFLLAPALLALTAACLYAPADVPQKPITSPGQRSMLRKLSLLFVILWGGAGLYLWMTQQTTLVYFYGGANLGLLWQSLSLTPAGYRLMAFLNPLFTRSYI